MSKVDLAELKLYELADHYILLSDLDDADAFKAVIDSLEDAIDDKADNLAKLIAAWEAGAKAYKDEADRLSKARKSRENKVEWAKAYLKETMEKLSKTKVGRFFSVSLQASPASCEVVDEAAVPMQFKKIVPQVLVVDKAAIIDHWTQTGEQVPGAMVARGKHIRIRM